MTYIGQEAQERLLDGRLTLEDILVLMKTSFITIEDTVQMIKEMKEV